jgi:hypothetical protein
VLLYLLVGASLAGAAWTLWERSQHDPWLRLLGQARTRLPKAGLKVPETAPPRQMAAQAEARFGPARTSGARLAAEAGSPALRQGLPGFAGRPAHRVPPLELARTGSRR